jgi:hypothetical protein
MRNPRDDHSVILSYNNERLRQMPSHQHSVPEVVITIIYKSPTEEINVRMKAMQNWLKILAAVKIPALLVIYAIYWISSQPFLLIMIRDLSGGGGLISQTITAVTIVLVNILWLYSWYRLAKDLRKTRS